MLSDREIWAEIKRGQLIIGGLYTIVTTRK